MTRFISGMAAAITVATVMVSPAAAQVVVTTPGTYGWTDVSRSGTGAPATATITTTQPRDGNGSLQLSMTGFSQPALATADPRVLGTLSELTNAGFDWLQTPGAPGNPTFRLFLTDINGPGSGGFGAMGWYGTDANGWQSSGNLALNGNFFFRAGGGQLPLTCDITGRTGSFDDRRQTIANWISDCNGGPNTYNLGSALVTGIAIDQGRWPGFTGTNVSYVDNVNIGYGRNTATTFNFEVTSTPEPSSLALLGTGLVGLVPMLRRRRR